MAKKFLVVLMTIIMLISIMGISVKNMKADSMVNPDLITSSVIWLSPSVKDVVTNGTFGIVTSNGPFWFAVDVPGGREGRGDLVIFSKIVPPVASGVALILSGKNLNVYFNPSNVVNLSWLELSISSVNLENKFDAQDLVVGQVLEIQNTGAYEKETNYCCSPPITKVSYYYKIYLSSNSCDQDIMIGIMIPDYEIDQVLGLKGDYVWVSLKTLKVYFWVLQ